MPHCSCGSGVPWCARADAMFKADGMHVLDVRWGYRELVITVETDADVTGCHSCGGARERARATTGHGS